MNMEDELQENSDTIDIHEVREGAPFAAAAYIPFFWLLIFALKGENAFARLHARQAAVIFFLMLFFSLHGFIPFVWAGLAWFINSLLVLASFYGVCCALAGRAGRIFIIGDLAEKTVI